MNDAQKMKRPAQPTAEKIFYLCDGKVEDCQKRCCYKKAANGPCRHTTDINHAINFKKVGQGDSISYKEKNVDAGIVFDDNSIRVQAGRINLESDIQYQRSLPEDEREEKD